ncbi:MAG: 3D domain-containing protein [Deltaproteobacteria bacterium]
MLQSKKPLLILILSFILYTMIPAKSLLAAEANLYWGSTGAQVTQVQNTLSSRGYLSATPNGVFGPKTYDAVVRFQRDNGLPATGIVGTATRRALNISSAEVSRGASGERGRTLDMVATGYDNSYECNYPYYGGLSYTGQPLARGIVATDPNVIPMGTRLYVEGYGEAIAADQGNAIKGNRIDLYFDSRWEALNWGMKSVKVTIL